jgi:transcriptional regulator with XRE-family HTH domain
MSERSRYLPTKTYADVSPGRALRVVRELQGMTQTELAQAAGITQTAVSALEGGRESLGVDRAKALAAVLRVHPAVLLFADLAPSGVADGSRSKRAVRSDDPSESSDVPVRAAKPAKKRTHAA